MVHSLLGTVYLTSSVLAELKRIIEESSIVEYPPQTPLFLLTLFLPLTSHCPLIPLSFQTLHLPFFFIFSYNDSKWPAVDKVGRQELEIQVDKTRKEYTVAQQLPHLLVTFTMDAYW